MILIGININKNRVIFNGRYMQIPIKLQIISKFHIINIYSVRIGSTLR